MEHGHVDFTAVTIFGSIVLIVLIVATRRHLSERERQRTLRIALERGAALDPALLQQLLAPAQKPRSPHGLLVGGLVTVAFSIGLLGMGLALGTGPNADPEAMRALPASAAMFFFVGAALLLASKLVKRAESGQRPGADEPGM
ncbi:MAG: hypothetical protein RLZZ393_1938 [Pseudomonadota bacterium]|jgi:formate-dependent nitrite reductase membrane component NrfD